MKVRSIAAYGITLRSISCFLKLLAVGSFFCIPAFSREPTIQLSPLFITEIPELFIVELGELPCGKKTEFSVPLRNQLNRQLHIHQVVSSCGCISASDTPLKLNHGEQGLFSFTFNAPVREGKGVQSTRFVLSPDGNHYFKVQFRYDAVAKLEIHPKELSVAGDKEVSFVIRVLENDEFDASDLEISFGSQILRIESVVAGNDNDLKVNARLNPGTLLEGRHLELIRVSDRLNSRVIAEPVLALDVKRGTRVFPRTVLLHSSPTGEISGMFVVRPAAPIKDCSAEAYLWDASESRKVVLELTASPNSSDSSYIRYQAYLPSSSGLASGVGKISLRETGESTDFSFLIIAQEP